MYKLVEDTGFEPVTFGLQDRRSAKNELIPHILQNTSRANYLHSAETLLSWSAEPHRILKRGAFKPSTCRLNKEHQATYFANISNFPVALRE